MDEVYKILENSHIHKAIAELENKLFLYDRLSDEDLERLKRLRAELAFRDLDGSEMETH